MQAIIGQKCVGSDKISMCLFDIMNSYQNALHKLSV